MLAKALLVTVLAIAAIGAIATPRFISPHSESVSVLQPICAPGDPPPCPPIHKPQ